MSSQKSEEWGLKEQKRKRGLTYTYNRLETHKPRGHVQRGPGKGVRVYGVCGVFDGWARDISGQTGY